MTMQRYARQLAIVLILCFFACGCGPRLGYTGSPLPESETATIEGSLYFYGIAVQELGIQRVDDLELAGYGIAAPDKVQVRPGFHQCTARFLVHGGNRTTWVDYPFPITVAAGRSYKLEFENYDGETYIWMNDKATSKLVAGAKPGKR